MNPPIVRQFRLSPVEGAGVSCGLDGAFIGPVPLLEHNGEAWTQRGDDKLSDALSRVYGLPVDVAAKSKGLAAVAQALNTGDIARAQIATLFLHFPDPLSLAKRTPSRDEAVRLVLALHRSGLLKINNLHYPAKTPGGKGGQFAPKNADLSASEDKSDVNPPDFGDTVDARDGPKIAAEEGVGQDAVSASVEAGVDAGEHEAERAASRTAIREAALGAEKGAIRLAARRLFREAALEALQNVGKKLVLSEIPIVGFVADLSTVYDIYRFVKEFAELRTAIAAATRFVNEGTHNLAQLRVTQEAMTFESYPAFVKREIDSRDELEKRFGSAGPGFEYHHIIERGAGEAKSVTETTENIIRIPTILHEAINGRYSQKVAESGNSTLREWLKTQPVAVKRAWGIKVLRELGIIVGE